jgi:Uma2 family endonuclease
MVYGVSTIPTPHHQYGYQEYLALDESSPHKNEYLDGAIYAMAGGTLDHAALCAAVIGELQSQLRGKPCRVFTADARIRVRETGLATYPDASVICGKPELDPEGRNTATNPIVLVEVLSDGTEAYDRGEKRTHYQRIPALQEYLLVSQREPRLELWRRSRGDWSYEVLGPGQRLDLESIGCQLDVDELYRRAIGEFE